MRDATIRLSMLLVVLGMAVASPGRADAAINLIKNGGFDDQGTNPNSYTRYTPGQPIGTPGWTVMNRAGGLGGDGSSVDVVNTGYTESNPQTAPVRAKFVAQDGPNSLDLTGGGNTGPNNGVFQNIITNVGQDYVVSFYVGRLDDSPPPGSYLNDVRIGLTISDGGGGTILSNIFTNDVAFQNTVNWRLFTVGFRALSNTTKIAFTNATVASTNYAGLDTVSVTAVPEPSPLILGSLAGLAGVGFARRRGRAVSVSA